MFSTVLSLPSTSPKTHAFLQDQAHILRVLILGRRPSAMSLLYAPIPPSTSQILMYSMACPTWLLFRDGSYSSRTWYHATSTASELALCLDTRRRRRKTTLT